MEQAYANAEQTNVQQAAAAETMLSAALSAAGGASQHQQASASNDGLPPENSQQHAAASVNAHGTGLEEELPISDAETDLSSVGLRRSAQGRHALPPLQATVNTMNKVSSTVLGLCAFDLPFYWHH